MDRGIPLGKIFGIEIRVQWSWLLIVLLLSWNLSTVFGDVHPDWSTAQNWAVAVSATLLFFGSVLAHELAHSLVAKARGINVRSITLHLFGGVSNIQREPASPGHEFWMALVGPLTSFVIGGILLLAGGASTGALAAGMGNLSDPNQLLSQLGPGLTIVLWLGSVNIVVGAFNLIPGFPLDGGRVLRSIFWAITDNLRRATRWASWVGQGIAWLMIVTGIAMVFGVQIPVLGTGLISGLWLAFIGWFLNGASAQSYQNVVVHDILDDVPVSRMMRRDPPTCSVNCTVSELVDNHIMRSDDQAFPVVDNGQLRGIVTLDDVRSAPRDTWDDKLVSDIMTKVDDLVTVGPDDDASEALQRLTARDIRQLPVVEGGQLKGLLRRRDMVKWLQLHSELSRPEVRRG